MNCFSPYFTYVAGANLPLPFPCGKCLACREQSAKTWRLRCELEAMVEPNFAFVTLTYSNENLPFFGSLQPSHLSSYLKRLRKSLDYPIRFFACGEYGTKRKRPHYHLIIFGLKEADYHKCVENWHYADLSKYSRGVDIQKGNYESLGYVAGYVGKKSSVNDWYSELKEPPFHRCSLGLGLKGYLLKFGAKFQPMILDAKNRSCYVGRYIRNKICEMEGTLDYIKELGIENLALKVADILEIHKEKIPQALKMFGLNTRPFPDLKDKLLALWKYVFEPNKIKFIEIALAYNRKNPRLDL